MQNTHIFIIRILTGITVIATIEAFMMYLLFNNKTICGVLLACILGYFVYVKHRSIYCDLRALGSSTTLIKENLKLEFDSYVFDAIDNSLTSHRFDF